MQVTTEMSNAIKHVMEVARNGESCESENIKIFHRQMIVRHCVNDRRNAARSYLNLSMGSALSSNRDAQPLEMSIRPGSNVEVSKSNYHFYSEDAGDETIIYSLLLFWANVTLKKNKQFLSKTIIIFRSGQDHSLYYYSAKPNNSQGSN